MPGNPSSQPDQFQIDAPKKRGALVKSGLAKSNGEARRTVDQGGAYINNRRVTSHEQRLTPADLASETVLVVRSGKKKYALLKFAS